MRSFFIRYLRASVGDVSCVPTFANSLRPVRMKFLPAILLLALTSFSIAEEPPVAKAVPATTRDITTQLQIFLDQQLFGPGKIDGRPGEFVGKALKRYQRAHGLPETGVLDANIPIDSVYPVYTFYTFKEEDLKFVGPSPTKPEEQCKLKFLPYPSLLEFLTERYHCAPEFLAKINKGVNLEALKPGDQVRVPNVEPFVLPGATHLLQVQNPRAMAEGLAAFFARHPLPG